MTAGLRPDAVAPSPTLDIEVVVNGTAMSASVDPRRNLVDLLRRELHLTGTVVGCDLGTCGSCTVLVDGEPVRSCLMLAVEADGHRVETVEGLEIDGKPGELQQAFAEHGALQCGFCTPGFLMLGTDLVRRERCLSRERVAQALSANLCRCTGYAPIIDAVHACSSRGAGDE
ncbi:MAG: aerobic carbon-monoxide dehydrogenase small subunit [Pseudonocardiales bacterium]|nr:aerobic carbon-monoxide dehydrogenase small subunit [Pseudonocardiales bacterium]